MTVAALPLGDWQFWLVTALAAGAVWIVVAPLLPRRRGKPGPCPGCPTGEAAQKPRAKHVDLTIGGRRVRSADAPRGPQAGRGS